jgi:uncharacterized protein with PIN domain
MSLSAREELQKTPLLSNDGKCAYMQDRVDDPPVVRCPGCNQPMEAKERTPVKDLVDIRYVCAGCGMETKRTVADEAR